MRFVTPVLVVGIALGVGTAFVRADESLQGIACRSVHLGYPAPEGAAFYTEVTVDKTAPGTYFMACGWDKGYFGMQELGGGKKVILFSVWDSDQDDPKAVGADRRVKLLHKDEKVRVGRFGGEGTGGQSFLDYDWRVGETYRYLVTAKVRGQRTEYAGYFYAPEDKVWKHLVTFSTITGGRDLRGYYSFVEDFKRDRVSATKTRQAHFGNAWFKTRGGKWEALTKARFTADSNPVTNIDAGVDGDRFFLTTGGDTKNTGTKLNESMSLPRQTKRTPPEGLPGPLNAKEN
jgi:hypothetical protein